MAKRSLEKYIAKNNYKGNIKETDSTIELSIRDSSVKPFDLILYFNKDNNCYKQTEIYNCDSCLKKEIGHFFENKRLNWTKISEGKFIANKKFILDIVSDATKFSYVLRKDKLSKDVYENLIKP